jgi:hypothetical protein
MFHVEHFEASKGSSPMQPMRFAANIEAASRKRMRSGDRPGLQNRRAAGFPVTGGFDSHSLPPSLSSARLGDYVSGVRGVCFHMIVEVLAGEGTVCTGVTGAKISRFAMHRMAAVELAARGAGRGIGRQGKQQSEEHRSTQHADKSHWFPS